MDIVANEHIQSLIYRIRKRERESARERERIENARHMQVYSYILEITNTERETKWNWKWGESSLWFMLFCANIWRHMHKLNVQCEKLTNSRVSSHLQCRSSLNRNVMKFYLIFTLSFSFQSLNLWIYRFFSFSLTSFVINFSANCTNDRYLLYTIHTSTWCFCMFSLLCVSSKRVRLLISSFNVC